MAHDSAASLVELQETVSRLSSHKGVQAVLILNRKGDVIVDNLRSSSTENPSATELALQTSQLLSTASGYLQCLQAEDEVSFLQVRSTQKREIMIAPHQGFVLAVLKQS